jgi:hypothetical protein
MDKFRILFHGQFANAQTPAEGFPVEDGPYEGFYASRLVAASSAGAAIIRGRELIREELDSTLLRGRQGDLLSVDVEECEAVGGTTDGLPNKGFTFY